MNDILKLSLTEATKLIKDKKISSTELTNLCLDRIKEKKSLNNFITVCNDEAISAAKEIDKKIAKGEDVGALGGVPISLKDNISLKDVKLSCASKMLENYYPVFDASVVTALKNSGAVIIGKTNMDEFAMGGANETSVYGVARNYYDESKIVGGSSGGAANSVSSLENFAAVASDTGGSIRQPASYCGVVGIKPTYSVVSRSGVASSASSLDQVGALTRTVLDSAALLNVLAFKDKKDATSNERNVADYTKFSTDIKGKRIGIAKEFFSSALDSGVKAKIMAAVKKYESMGAVVVELSIPSLEAALATYYIISCAEISSNMARFDGIQYGMRSSAKDLNEVYFNTRTEFFGDEVKRRIMLGNYVLSSSNFEAYFMKASKVRTLIKQDFQEAFKKCDVLVTPTTMTTAYNIGTKETDFTKAYLGDSLTTPVNIAGLPAMSLPCGRDELNLPIGLQLIAKAFDEMSLFSFGAALESTKLFETK